MRGERKTVMEDEEREWEGALRAEEPVGELRCCGASHFPTSLRCICFVSLTRNTIVR